MGKIAAIMSKREMARAYRPRTHAELVVEIARIGNLDALALRALWPDWFGCPPPARMRRETLGLAISYRIQCETLGGLSRQAARTLDAIAAQEFGEVAASAAVTPHRLKPGTKLVREWHGIVHEVAVVADGFVWNGARHRSLSAIARAITGTRWNGLVFFGLKTAGSSKAKSGTAAAIGARAADA